MKMKPTIRNRNVQVKPDVSALSKYVMELYCPSYYVSPAGKETKCQKMVSHEGAHNSNGFYWTTSEKPLFESSCSSKWKSIGGGTAWSCCGPEGHIGKHYAGGYMWD